MKIDEYELKDYINPKVNKNDHGSGLQQGAIHEFCSISMPESEDNDMMESLLSSPLRAPKVTESRLAVLIFLPLETFFMLIFMGVCSTVYFF